VTVAAETKEHEIEERTVRVEPLAAVECLQSPLVGAGARLNAFVRGDEVQVRRRHRCGVAEGLAHHPHVAQGIIPCHDAVVTEEPVDARPRHPLDEAGRGQQGVEPLRRRAA
jgi:hypothetical protein